jgi:hypothetical protein
MKPRCPFTIKGLVVFGSSARTGPGLASQTRPSHPAGRPGAAVTAGIATIDPARRRSAARPNWPFRVNWRQISIGRPKQGQELAAESAGRLQAHITDRSGVSSQCTYATDNFNRGFGLPANSTYDLRIVPSVPQFRNWNVTITCDNGTTTQASTYF